VVGGADVVEACVDVVVVDCVVVLKGVVVEVDRVEDVGGVEVVIMVDEVVVEDSDEETEVGLVLATDVGEDDGTEAVVEVGDEASDDVAVGSLVLAVVLVEFDIANCLNLRSKGRL